MLRGLFSLPKAATTRFCMIIEGILKFHTCRKFRIKIRRAGSSHMHTANISIVQNTVFAHNNFCRSTLSFLFINGYLFPSWTNCCSRLFPSWPNGWGCRFPSRTSKNWFMKESSLAQYIMIEVFVELCKNIMSLTINGSLFPSCTNGPGSLFPSWTSDSGLLFPSWTSEH